MIRTLLIIPLVLLSLSCTSAVSTNKTATQTYYIIVQRVTPNSPADKANIKAGDIILEINNEPITTLDQLNNTLARIPSGDKCYITINRNNQTNELALIVGKGRRYRYGFIFKKRDSEITTLIKPIIWPDEINPDFKKFTIPLQVLHMMNKGNRSPKKKVLFRLKELLISKGYLFTESFENADFIAKVDFKQPKSNNSSTGKRKKLPFDALRVVFIGNKGQKTFLKVTGTFDEEKARYYGAKEHVYSVLEAMIEDFPAYQGKKKLAQDFLASEKEHFDKQSSSVKDRHLGTSSY